MRLFGYPYNDLVICKDSPDYLCVLLLSLGGVGLCISLRFQILCIFQGCAFVSRFPGFCRIGRICLRVSTSSFLLFLLYKKFLQNFSKIFSKTHPIAPFKKIFSMEHAPNSPTFTKIF